MAHQLAFSQPSGGRPAAVHPSCAHHAKVCSTARANPEGVALRKFAAAASRSVFPSGRGLLAVAVGCAGARRSVRGSGARGRLRALGGAAQGGPTVERFKCFGPADDPIEIEIDKKLGVGAQGTVYLCHRQNDPSLIYAAKVVAIYEDDTEGRAEALDREVKALLRAQGHEAVVTCIGSWDVGPVVMHQFPTQGRTIVKYKMIVTELVEGGELASFIGRQGRLDEAIARGVFRQVAGAVQFLHGKQVLHRDLKCENILVCSSELSSESRVKLVDFGVAKDVAGSFAQTCVGTADIMAPELVCAELMLAPGGQSLPTVGPFTFASPQEVSPGFGLRTQRKDGRGALVDGIDAGGQAARHGVGDGWAIASIAGTDIRQMLFLKNPDKPKERAITEILMELSGDFPVEFIEAPKRSFSEAIDCWSLGVVLYSMLVGKVPFKTPLDIAVGELPLDQLVGVSDDAVDLLRGLLRLDPAKRLTPTQIMAHPWLANAVTA